MTNEHFDDFELLAYLDLNADAVDLDSVNQHLLSCSECAARFDSLRQFNALLGDKNIHRFSAQRRILPQTPLHELVEMSNRRSESDKDAERIFAALMGRPIEHWLVYLRDHPEKRTEGLSRRLIAEARVELDRRPRHALKLLDVAGDVASTLRDASVIAEQGGVIAKERANALRMLGRYPEALECLDFAERFLAQLAVPAFDLNFVEWARAAVLFSMTRYTQALTLAQTVSKVFRQFGETYFANQAQILEANALCEQGHPELARSMYVRLLSYFAEEGDDEVVARLIANIAECEVRLDRPASAEIYAAEAMRRYEVLGKPAERIRVQWSTAYRLFRQGYLSEALTALESASAAFESIGMTDAAGGVGLDLTEVFLALEQWDEAEQLARRLAQLFAGAETPVYYARAYNYLHAAVMARKVTPDLLEYLRSYLSESESAEDENLTFQPPTG